MGVPMRIPRERRDAPLARASHLGAHLGRKLGRADAAREHAAGELSERPEPPFAIDEARHRRRLAHRRATHEIDVKADLELGLAPGERRAFG